MKFKTTIVSDRQTKTACRPTSVLRASDGKLLGVYESRKACAIALGIDSPTVSCLIHGYYGRTTNLVDARHGVLRIVDGVVTPPPPAKRIRVRKPSAAAITAAVKLDRFNRPTKPNKNMD